MLLFLILAALLVQPLAALIFTRSCQFEDLDRHNCLNCGYSRKGLHKKAPCPECGLHPGNLKRSAFMELCALYSVARYLPLVALLPIPYIWYQHDIFRYLSFWLGLPVVWLLLIWAWCWLNERMNDVATARIAPWISILTVLAFGGGYLTLLKEFDTGWTISALATGFEILMRVTATAGLIWGLGLIALLPFRRARLAD